VLAMLKTFLSLSVVSSLLIMTTTSALTPVAPKPQKKTAVKSVTKVKTAKVLNTKIYKKTKANKKLADKGNAGGFGLTAKVSTLGIGVDLTYGIMDKLNVRLNLNGGSLNIDNEIEGINYDGKLNLQSVGGLLDFHPTGGGFRVSAGIYNNSNNMDVDASGINNSNVEIGGRRYDLSDATLNTKVTFKSTAPYLGLGWGNAADKDSKFSLTTDLGVLFQGEPSAKLSTKGTVKDVQTATAVDVSILNGELAKEEVKLNDGDLKKFKLLPVVSLGMNYRF